MNPELQQKLNLLKDLIQRERDYARNLKIAELMSLQEEKGSILSEFKSISGCCPNELKELAAHLRDENRRNARLLWATLNFLRQSMSNCCRQLTPVMYGRRGNRMQNIPLGVLHAGRA